MKTAEQRSDALGVSYRKMMENAGSACAKSIANILHDDVNAGRIVVLCGAGNNGGDGFVIARKLREKGFFADIVLVCGEPKTDCAGVNFMLLSRDWIYPCEEAHALLGGAVCAVDCVYGTGFHGELSEQTAEVFAAAKQCKYRIAVDVPSGVNSDTGELDERCFKPTHTLIIAALKQGLVNMPAADVLGDTQLLDIGIAEQCYDGNSIGFLTDSSMRRPFPQHGRNTHKGTFGRLVGFAGSLCYNGAAFMCANAALRSGVGLYFAAAPLSAVKIIASALHEAVYVPLPEDSAGFAAVTDDALREIVLPNIKKANAVIVGCGLGCSENTRRLAEFVTRNAECPVIIDADGINSIAENIDVLKERTGETILTPHPLEFSRISGISVGEIQRDRMRKASEFAVKYGVTAVLKGADTVIAAADGRICVNARACSGLSKGGSGDVLTGIIGAFAAQGVEPFTAAASGVYCHSKAAEILCERMPAESILPTDIIAALPEVYRKCD